MPRTSRGAGFLFWLMMLTGCGCLAVCLILPPWLEYRAVQAAHAAARREVAHLETRLTICREQSEHARYDPAYLERRARKEFGLTAPGVTTILVEREPPTVGKPVPSRARESYVGNRGASLIERVARRSLLAQVFMARPTRPIVMIMSVVLLLAALLLLDGIKPARAAGDAK